MIVSLLFVNQSLFHFWIVLFDAYDRYHTNMNSQCGFGALFNQQFVFRVIICGIKYEYSIHRMILYPNFSSIHSQTLYCQTKQQ